LVTPDLQIIEAAPAWQYALKRAMDIGAALAGLLLLAPLLLGLALAVWVCSGGPVIYREQRLGRHGKPFALYKFRTLHIGTAHQRSIAPEDDARITRIGLPLRRTRLDELPQLYNLLRGDMSLVGPRPIVQRHADALDASTRDALWSVRPGVTDPASVLFFAEDAVLAGRPNAEQDYLQVLLPVKAQVQLRYVQQWRLRLDIRTVFLTLARVWSPRARRDSMQRVQDILTAAGAMTLPADRLAPP
jgi:lipopolysaccharide/colanic/teichoic acid biosynthesis glycosyltransferase